MDFSSNSEKETIQLGRKLSLLLKRGDILCLSGELGTGKTIFTKGIARGLGIQMNKVHSPTFVLMNHYEGRLPLYHFDLYRIDDFKEICFLGYEEFFYGNGVSVIEWAEKLGPFLPKDYLEIKIAHLKDPKRAFKIKAHGLRFKRLIRRLS